MLTGSILLELTARARRVRAPRLPGLRAPQVAANQLVSAAALLFIMAPTGSPTVPANPPTLAAHRRRRHANSPSRGKGHATGNGLAR